MRVLTLYNRNVYQHVQHVFNSKKIGEAEQIDILTVLTWSDLLPNWKKKTEWHLNIFNAHESTPAAAPFSETPSIGVPVAADGVHGCHRLLNPSASQKLSDFARSKKETTKKKEKREKKRRKKHLK